MAGSGATVGIGRAVIELEVLVRIKNPAWLLAWRGVGCAVRVPVRLLGRASSIPPSKKDDEPKNVDKYEHAEEPGRDRAHDRLGGDGAALEGHGWTLTAVSTPCPWDHRRGRGPADLW